jgi:hypothetical protein
MGPWCLQVVEVKHKFALSSDTFDPIKYPKGQRGGSKPADDKHVEQLYGYMVSNGRWLMTLDAQPTLGSGAPAPHGAMCCACAGVGFGVLCSDTEFWFARLVRPKEGGGSPQLMITRLPMKVRGSAPSTLVKHWPSPCDTMHAASRGVGSP